MDPATGLITVPSQTGQFPVQLSVTQGGRVGTAALSLAIHGPPSVSITSITPRSDSYEVAFSATAGGASPIVAMTWDLGDGTIRAGQAVSHAYAAPGAYPVTFRAANAVGLASEVGASVLVADTTLADGWSAGALGAPARRGSVNYQTETGSTTIVGGGAGLGGTADEAHATWTSAWGDFSALVRLESMEGAEGAGLAADASAGLFLRAGVEPDAIGVALTVGGDGVARMSWRTTTGAAASQSDLAVTGLPRWLLLLRTGGTTTAYLSENAETFEVLASVTVPLPPEVVVGLAAASGAATSTLVRAAFSGVEILSASDPGALLASPASDTAIHLAWSATAAVTTVLERLEGEVWVELSRFTAGASTVFEHTGLMPATNYTYRLQTLNEYGVGPYSEPVTARTLIRIDALFAAQGLVFTSDEVRQPGVRNSGLWFRSEGYLRAADGTPRFSVWGVFNRSPTPRVLTVTSSKVPDFSRTFTVAPQTAAFVASPIVSSPAQHELQESGVVIGARAPADATFSDERLVAD